MTPKELEEFLTAMGLVLNYNNLTWRLTLGNRMEISYEMFRHVDDPKRVLIYTLRNMRRDLDLYIQDLEQKIIDYK